MFNKDGIKVKKNHDLLKHAKDLENCRDLNKQSCNSAYLLFLCRDLEKRLKLSQLKCYIRINALGCVSILIG